MIKLFSKDVFNTNGVLIDFASSFDVSHLSKHDCILLTEDYTFIDAFNEQLGVTNSLVVWKSNSLADMLASGTTLTSFFQQCLAYESSRKRDLVIYATAADLSQIIWGYLKAVYPLGKNDDLGKLYDCYKKQLVSTQESLPFYADLPATVTGMTVDFLPPETHQVLPLEFLYADYLLRGEQSQLSYTFWTLLAHMCVQTISAALHKTGEYLLSQGYRSEDFGVASMDDLIADKAYADLWSQANITTTNMGTEAVAKCLLLGNDGELATLAKEVWGRDFATLSGKEWYHDLTANMYLNLHLNGALLDLFQNLKGTDGLAVYGV